jgi:hypothetical protein
MKRNLDLIRHILFECEKSPPAEPIMTLEVPDNVSGAEVAEHIEIMAEAGLLDAEVLNTHDDSTAFIIRKITWEGHDFISAVREDTLWRKAKEAIIKPGASFTFDVLKEWLKAQIHQKLGMTST